MLEQRLPHVKQEIFESVSANLESDGDVSDWIVKLSQENPHIIIGVDALGTPGGIMVAALVYALLDSQAEANQMNEDFK